ncbi:otoferlin [Trichonephila clavata]|uniref:Otoferlin n=1 Tax=Trichonephila clavata TaxID=2740835 RepID=A0A8X6FZV5_TRICU|nr:otoferlin [Trichonephila clavata]
MVGWQTEEGSEDRANKKKKTQTEEESIDDDEENKDWWTRYFASYEAMIKPPQQQKRTLKGTSTAVRLAQRLSPKSHRKLMTDESLIKIYSCELENVIDFGGFKEWLHSFELYRGKRTGDELEDQNRIVGVFKVKIYFEF